MRNLIGGKDFYRENQIKSYTKLFKAN